MSLRNKISKAVDKAFNAVGDIVQEGKLSSKSVSGYDFTSGTVQSTSSTKVVEVIILSQKKPTTDTFTIEAIMKSGIDLSVYDTLTVDKMVYTIADYDDDGFVIKAILKKERK